MPSIEQIAQDDPRRAHHILVASRSLREAQQTVGSLAATYGELQAASNVADTGESDTAVDLYPALVVLRAGYAYERNFDQHARVSATGQVRHDHPELFAGDILSPSYLGISPIDPRILGNQLVNAQGAAYADAVESNSDFNRDVVNGSTVVAAEIVGSANPVKLAEVLVSEADDGVKKKIDNCITFFKSAAEAAGLSTEHPQDDELVDFLDKNYNDYFGYSLDEPTTQLPPARSFLSVAIPASSVISEVQNGLYQTAVGFDPRSSARLPTSDPGLREADQRVRNITRQAAVALLGSSIELPQFDQS